MFRGSVNGTGYPLNSPVSPSLPLPSVTVCHHVSTGLYLIRTLTGSFVSRYLCKSNKRARLPFFNYPCNVVMCSCNEQCSDAARSGLNAPDMNLSAPEDGAAVNCDLSSDSKCQHVSLCTQCFIPKLSRTVGHFRNIA